MKNSVGLLIFLSFLYSISLSDVGTKCFCTSGCNHTVCTLNTSTSYCYTDISNSTIKHGCYFTDNHVQGCQHKDEWLLLLGTIISRCCTEDFCNQCPEVTELCPKVGNNLTISNQIPNCTMTCLTTSSTQFESTTTVQSSISSSSSSSPSMTTNNQGITLIVFGVVSVLFILIILVLFVGAIVFIVSNKRRRDHNQVIHISDTDISSSSAGMSSSLYGPRLLRPRTMSHDVRKISVIGTGRFGKVYKCVYDDKEIAMKVFKNMHMPVFEREVEIYSTYMLSHDHILSFINHDQYEYADSIELRLFFEFHANGTLQEHLKSKDLFTFEECHAMAITLASGLSYLHKKIVAGRTKPGIAHRDLKSSNILVKSDFTLCIADLGLSVKQAEMGEGVDQIPSNKLSGTKRYMSPEILSGTMDFARFVSYTESDIYSVSLVLWEIFACCTVNGVSHSYSLPYQGFVTTDPDIPQMRQCVCVEEHRPPIPPEWSESETLNPVRQILMESWGKNPRSRLSALRIYKILKNIEFKKHTT